MDVSSLACPHCSGSLSDWIVNLFHELHENVSKNGRSLTTTHAHPLLPLSHQPVTPARGGDGISTETGGTENQVNDNDPITGKLKFSSLSPNSAGKNHLLSSAVASDHHNKYTPNMFAPTTQSNSAVRLTSTSKDCRLTTECVPETGIPEASSKEQQNSTLLKIQTPNRYPPELMKRVYKYLERLPMRKGRRKAKRPYSCTRCPARFFTKRGLNLHHCAPVTPTVKLPHDPFTPVKVPTQCGIGHKCSLCGKVEIGEESFKDHMKLHSTEVSNICSVCGKRFPSEVRLSFHVMKEHSCNLSDDPAAIDGKPRRQIALKRVTMSSLSQLRREELEDGIENDEEEEEKEEVLVEKEGDEEREVLQQEEEYIVEEEEEESGGEEEDSGEAPISREEEMSEQIEATNGEEEMVVEEEEEQERQNISSKGDSDICKVTLRRYSSYTTRMNCHHNLLTPPATSPSSSHTPSSPSSSSSFPSCTKSIQSSTPSNFLSFDATPGTARLSSNVDNSLPPTPPSGNGEKEKKREYSPMRTRSYKRSHDLRQHIKEKHSNNNHSETSLAVTQAMGLRLTERRLRQISQEESSNNTSSSDTIGSESQPAEEQSNGGVTETTYRRHNCQMCPRSYKHCFHLRQHIKEKHSNINHSEKSLAVTQAMGLRLTERTLRHISQEDSSNNTDSSENGVLLQCSTPGTNGDGTTAVSSNADHSLPPTPPPGNGEKEKKRKYGRMHTRSYKQSHDLRQHINIREKLTNTNNSETSLAVTQAMGLRLTESRLRQISQEKSSNNTDSSENGVLPQCSTTPGTTGDGTTGASSTVDHSLQPIPPRQISQEKSSSSNTSSSDTIGSESQPAEEQSNGGATETKDKEKVMSADKLRYSCHKCNNSFSTTKSFRKHKWIFHSKQLNFCPRSYAWSRGKTTKNREYRRHHCQMCPKSYQRSHDLRQHIKEKHSNNNHSETSLAVTQAMGLRLTERRLRQISQEKSTDSSETSGSESQPVEEQSPGGATETEEKVSAGEQQRYSCHRCNNSFSTKKSFRKHKLIFHPFGHYEVGFESSKAHYHCAKCHKYHTEKSSLLEHMSQVHNEGCCDKYIYSSSRECSLCAVYYSSSVDSVKKQMAGSDKDKKSHQCTTCDKSYARQGSLRRHIQDKHPTLGWNFRQTKQRMIRDKREQQTEGCAEESVEKEKKSFRCPECSKSFTRKNALTLHLKWIHPHQVGDLTTVEPQSLDANRHPRPRDERPGSHKEMAEMDERREEEEEEDSQNKAKSSEPSSLTVLREQLQQIREDGEMGVEEDVVENTEKMKELDGGKDIEEAEEEEEEEENMVVEEEDKGEEHEVMVVVENSEQEGLDEVKEMTDEDEEEIVVVEVEEDTEVQQTKNINRNFSWYSDPNSQILLDTSNKEEEVIVVDDGDDDEQPQVGKGCGSEILPVLGDLHVSSKTKNQQLMEKHGSWDVIIFKHATVP